MAIPSPTFRGQAVLVLGALLAAGAQVLRDPALWTPGVSLVVLVLAAGLASLLGRPRWRVERRLVPDEIERGDAAEVELRLRRRGGLPLLELTDDPGHALGPAVALAPPAGRDGALRYPVRGGRRGVHELNDLTWTLTDPLGLWTRSGRLRAPATLTVWPRVAAWGDAHLSALSDRLRARLTIEPDDALVRDYRAGDDPRRIHWRSTARTGTTMVRREQQDAEAEVLILLDTRRPGGSTRANDAGHAAEMHAERAIEAAACAAVALLRTGAGVRIVAANGHDVQVTANASDAASGQTAAQERVVLNWLARLSVDAPAWHADVESLLASAGADELTLAALVVVDDATLALLDGSARPGIAVVCGEDADGLATLRTLGWQAAAYGSDADDLAGGATNDGAAAWARALEEGIRA